MNINTKLYYLIICSYIFFKFVLTEVFFSFLRKSSSNSLNIRLELKNNIDIYQIGYLSGSDIADREGSSSCIWLKSNLASLNFPKRKLVRRIRNHSGKREFQNIRLLLYWLKF
jgi:hypothetical protein